MRIKNASSGVSLYPATHHAERIFYYQPLKEELNFSGINFFVTIDQIFKFEKLNPKISVTVIGCEEKPPKKGKRRVVYFHSEVQMEKSKACYSVVLRTRCKLSLRLGKNLNRLLSKTKPHKCQTYVCEHCFQGFIRQVLLDMHSESCQSISIQAVSVVKEKISFKSWSTTEETLFRIYADFECILQECNEEDTIGKTIQVRKYIPCSVAWVLISNHPEVESRSILFRPSSTSDSTTEDLSSG